MNMGIFASAPRFALEVWTDGYGKGPESMRCAVHIDRGDDVRDGGLRRMWFVFSADEFRDVVEFRTGAVSDGIHKLTACGESWLFYDMDSFPRTDSGALACPYMRLHVPRLFGRAMLRIARRLWKADAEALANGTSMYDLKRHMVEFSTAHRAHVTRLYGQGKGAVRIEFQGERTSGWVAEACAASPKTPDNVRHDARSFQDMLERVLCIALNTTYGFHEKARVVISGDGSDAFDGYYWTAFDPRGRRIMNGGIINHGGKPGREPHDWSIHT